MSDDNLSNQDLLQIIELVQACSQCEEFHLKVGEFEIDLRKKGAVSHDAAPLTDTLHAEASKGVGPSRLVSFAATQAPVQYPAGTMHVKSALVGTLYRTPEPGGKPFVEIGDRVAADATVCIIEVLTLMHSIPAGVSGVVQEILVPNAAPVEFGQVLMVIAAHAPNE
jgi:acetyl-CoA carboxylase biotin carboxyl carrier protein